MEPHESEFGDGYSKGDQTSRRHGSLYFTDDTVVFKVEDTFFRVHRYFFKRYSKIFATMFSLPPEPGKPMEGQSDDHPIRLEDVKSQDFERLLLLFYPV